MAQTTQQGTDPHLGGATQWGSRARRLAQLVLTIGLTLLGLLAVTFFIGRLMPIDPVVAIIGEQADQAAYQTVYHQLGLDKPLPVQFFIYARSIFSGDFGFSLTTGNPVAEDLWRVWPATMELATLALVLGVLAGVPLGIIAAICQNSVWDHLVRLFSLIGHSIPNFWLGLMALVVFYAKLGWIGGAGRTSMQFIDALDPVTGSILLDSLMARRWDMFADALRHVIMPALILASGSMAFLSRMTRSFMLEQLNQEYIVTAKLKGLGTAGLVAHAMRNIGVQLVTIVVLSYGGLLDGAVLTETVFAWPGFGRYMTTGLMNGDMNVTLACVFLVGAIFITMNLCADALYRILDPRTR
ncbi:MAG TPA: ABC transporter permease [Deferrisomatales bacterium]|nr:ABC transporter permease [Deferrisomatales bacterium]